MSIFPVFFFYSFFHYMTLYIYFGFLLTTCLYYFLNIVLIFLYNLLEHEDFVLFLSLFISLMAKVVITEIYRWCSGYHYCTVHSKKPELRFCAVSNPAHGVLEIQDGEDLWQWSRLEITLNVFRRSIIPPKQFIIIIHHQKKYFFNVTKVSFIF